MQRWLSVAVMLGLSLGAQASVCSQFTNCSQCLKPREDLNCGWCSAGPAQYANGTYATQCMDHTSTGWVCYHLYMHDGCIQGYVCDETTGQCKLGAPGTGDTLDKCKKKCGVHPPSESYVCNTTTLTCEKGPGGIWKKDCDASCGNSTPAGLVGLWRGWNVQNNFTVGEYQVNFTNHTVSWGDNEALVAQISATLLRLTMTKGMSKGGTLYASFTAPGWPTGPETMGMSVAVQRRGAHQIPPDNTWDALGDDIFDVFVGHKCNSWSSKCNFEAAFKKNDLMTYDKCQVHGDCGSCIADPQRVCGWCDGIVTFADNTTCGTDGKGCCGGSSGFSNCSVAYRKTCPVMCDWTNWTHPQCRPATAKERKDPSIHTYENCDIVEKEKACDYEQQYFYCDVERGCEGPLTKEQCKAEKRCNVSSPDCDRTKCKTPDQYVCDKTRGQCTEHPGPATNTSYNTSAACMEACKVQEHYVCDKTRGQCSSRVGPATNTSYNTSSACKEACSNKDIEGVWRAISINKEFVGGEWDFFFSSQATGSRAVYKSRKTGETFTGTYEVGQYVDESVEPFGAYEVTITLTTGEALKGIFNSQYEGPIARALFLGLPKKSGDEGDKTFDRYMELQEFVLISCLPSLKHCDFSPANPDSELFV